MADSVFTLTVGIGMGPGTGHIEISIQGKVQSQSLSHSYCSVKAISPSTNPNTFQVLSEKALTVFSRSVLRSSDAFKSKLILFRITSMFIDHFTLNTNQFYQGHQPN